MKRYQLVVMSALCALLLASTVVTFVLYRRQSTQLDAVERQKANVCVRMKWELEAIVKKQVVGDVQGRIDHQLDQGLTLLCLGMEVPAVGYSEADWCWVMNHREDCYLDVAKKLLELHRAADHEARLRQ